MQACCPSESQRDVDGKVSDMRLKVNDKVSRLTTELNDGVARLQAEFNEKIERLRSNYQQEVSALERAFGEERSHLNGPRNALSPVYRLPPELLSRIFYLSLSTSQPPEVPSQINPYSRMHKESYYYSAGDGYESYDFEFWGGALDALQLCHICQHWRAVALGSSHLWSHIQVDRWTQPELLTFITENAKKAPIDLDLSWSSNIQAYDALLNFLEASIEQVESLAIRCYTPSLLTTEKSDVLQRLAALTRASLKSLQLVVSGGATTREATFLSFTMPNISCIEVRGIAIPWNSPIFLLPCLTHLALHDIPNLSTSNMGDLVSVLRQAAQLETLHIDLPRQKMVTWDDVGGQRAIPVELPNINNLQIISEFFDPLSILMKSIRFDHGRYIAAKISCGEFREHWQEICDYASGGRWAPEQVGIGYQRSGPLHGFVAGCDWRTAAYLDRDDKYRGIKWWEELPWATLSTGTNFPFPAMPSAQVPRVPWTFTNLRVFVVGNSEGSPTFKFPQSFWDELAELPTLEVILMKRPEPELVMQFLQATLMCEKNPARPAQAESSTQDPVPQPFPALKALIICALGKLTHEDLRISKLPIPKGFNALSSIELYLRYIAQKLRCWRDYGSKYMRDLYFYAEEEPLERENYRESEMLYDELDDETLRMLGDVAVRVVFGEVLAWDREKEGEEEDNESPDAGVATTSSADEKKGE